MKHIQYLTFVFNIRLSFRLILILQFVFPTGTYLTVRLWLYETVNVMEIEIFPSLYDIHVSEGLCSRLDSGGALYARDKTITPHQQRPDTFSRSWRYVMEILLLRPSCAKVISILVNFLQIKIASKHLYHSN